MQAALAALPWVESDSITTSRDKRQAKFTVKDPKRFDPEEVKRVLTEKGYAQFRVLTGPTEK